MNNASDYSSLRIDTDDQAFEKSCCSMLFLPRSRRGTALRDQDELFAAMLSVMDVVLVGAVVT